MAKDNLFELINSLTQSEKRYFKLFSQRHNSTGDSNYYKLFEVILKQKTYDEATVKLKLKNEISSKTFPVEKNYLYNLIIKSLVHHHQDANISFKIRNLLTSIEILYGKELTNQAIKRLRKVESLAHTHHKYEQLLEIYNWKIKLLFASLSENGISDEIFDIIDLKKKAIQKIENSSKVEPFYHYVYKTISHSGKSRNKITKEIISEIKAATKFVNENETSLESKINTYISVGLIHYYYGNYQMFFDNAEACLHLIQENPVFEKENPFKTIHVINNYATGCMYLKNEKEFVKTLTLFNSISRNSKNKAVRTKSLRSYYINATNYYIKTYEVKKALLYSEEFLKLIQQNKIELDDGYKSAFFYDCSCIYFYNNRLKESLRLLNDFFDLKVSVRTDIQSAAKILNMIIHYELKNFNHLEYILITTQRAIRKIDNYYEFESRIIELFTKLINSGNKKETVEIFKAFKADLVFIRLAPKEKKALEHFNYEAWVNNKLKE